MFTQTTTREEIDILLKKQEQRQIAERTEGYEKAARRKAAQDRRIVSRHVQAQLAAAQATDGDTLKQLATNATCKVKVLFEKDGQHV